MPDEQGRRSPTDVIVDAMEHAEEMKHCLVLFKGKNGDFGCLSNTGLAGCLVMMDAAKTVILKDLLPEEDGESHD